MRSLMRVALPLLVAAAVLGWGATTIVDVVAKSWFVHDVSLRARLAAAGVHGEAVVATKAFPEGRAHSVSDAAR